MTPQTAGDHTVPLQIGISGISRKLFETFWQFPYLKELKDSAERVNDGGWVSLACFRSNFGGLVLGCMDSYDSNQILILQGSRSTRLSKWIFDFSIFQCLCTVFPFFLNFAKFRDSANYCWNGSFSFWFWWLVLEISRNFLESFIKIFRDLRKLLKMYENLTTFWRIL